MADGDVAWPPGKMPEPVGESPEDPVVPAGGVVPAGKPPGEVGLLLPEGGPLPAVLPPLPVPGVSGVSEAGVPAAVPGVPGVVPGVPAAVPGVPAPVPGVPGAVPGVCTVGVALAGVMPEDCPWDATYLAAAAEAARAAASADPAETLLLETTSRYIKCHQGCNLVKAPAFHFQV